MNIKNYIEENETRFLDELFSLLRIPSISSQSEHKDDMVRCAERWKELIMAAGADKCDIYPTEGNPIVVGQKIIDPAAKTVLVYGHYDVMPEDPIELWNTEPFEPVIKDGKIWGRGEQHTDLLKCDVILVSDTGMIATDTPSITAGLRGLCNMIVKVTGPNRDLHSGIFGGAVANPINVLCDLVSGLINDKGEVTIPGFYDDVVVLSKEERALIAQAPFDEEEYKKSLDVKALYGEEGYSTIERTGIRPNLGVCGIEGGYTGEGFKTVLPATASANISMRLVANQDSHKIAELFQKHFENIAPDYVKVEVIPAHGGEAYRCGVDVPAYQAAEKAYIDVYGKRPIPTYSGGSIPIVAHFEKVLGVKSILCGFGLAEDNIHSPNENYKLEHFRRGIEVITHFYEHFCE